MNQSEYEAITCGRRKARENSREQVTIGFGLLLIDWESGASFADQSQRSDAKAKQTSFTFDTYLKSAF